MAAASAAAEQRKAEEEKRARDIETTFRAEKAKRKIILENSVTTTPTMAMARPPVDPNSLRQIATQMGLGETSQNKVSRDSNLLLRPSDILSSRIPFERRKEVNLTPSATRSSCFFKSSSCSFRRAACGCGETMRCSKLDIFLLYCIISPQHHTSNTAHLNEHLSPSQCDMIGQFLVVLCNTFSYQK